MISEERDIVFMGGKLVDKFGRKIDYLRLSVTDRCNLRCIYCMPEEGIKLLDKRELLTFEEILRTVKIFLRLGITKIKITGGEPLLRENILDLIASINKLEGIEDISVTTNGTLLKKYLEGLYEKGIKRINVSLDSLNPEKFRKITRNGNLNGVLNSIFTAIQKGFNPIKLNTVLTGLTDEEDILEFIKLTIKHPISVRFIEMMPIAKLDSSYIECGRIGTIVRKGKEINTRNEIGSFRESFKKTNTKNSVSTNISGTNNKNKGNLNISTDLNAKFNINIILRLIARVGSYYKIKGPIGYGPSVYYKIKKSKGSIGLIINDKRYCRFCNRIRITAKGSLKLCLFSKNELELKTLLRGNYSDDFIGKKIMGFIKGKPEDRESLLKIDGYQNAKISGHMHQIGG